ncbi:MAG: hypothetical protein F6K63_33800 [Moorea sp. SIO1G6]|uniref:hypothetical protein n=1 Tax=Moorena sp. SIO1G6 TaxID=2607840 RepID=UPI0013C0B0A6|nr:hypothetical protein [Moorena sp. SIO1G6]NET69108.1 hypothetical protein [Moorena sp. SIO1G6]
MPTNALCKLDYLSGALPTLHEPSLLRMVQDVSIAIIIWMRDKLLLHKTQIFVPYRI